MTDRILPPPAPRPPVTFGGLLEALGDLLTLGLFADDPPPPVM